MKRRNTEINVFSMSALDLFACSLGVFVLLTVVFLPFFPNTGDHPAVSELTLSRLSDAETAVSELSQKAVERQSQIATLSSNNEALQSKLTLNEEETKALNDQLRKMQTREEERERERLERERLEQERQEASMRGGRVEFPPLDVVIALDSTGSMRAQTEGLKSEITQFAQLLNELSPSVKMGVVEYKDRCDRQSIRTFDLVEMNNLTIPQIQKFAEGVEAGGDFCNSDGPEALKSALEAAVQMNWREEVQVQLIVIVTDNSAYPEEEGAALRLAANFASRGRGFAIGAAQVGADRETIRFLDELVSAGNGQRIRAGGSFTSTILYSLAGL